MVSLFSKDGPLRSASRPLRRATARRYALFRARRARRGSAATFIAVTGSSCKSTTTALLALMLREKGKVLEQVFRNTEKSVVKTLRRVRPDDDYAVLETGVANLGEMAPMADLVRPEIAIVTMVGLEHYSSFRTMEAVAQEKGGLVEAVRPGGIAFLNADDANVMAMAARTKERVVTFGREADADYRVLSVSQRFPGPLVVEIARADRKTEITVDLLGEHFWLPVVAAFAAAVELGVPEDAIQRACAEFKPLPGRCEMLQVPGGPVFVMDTSKAPWGTFELPLRTVEAIEAPRKRVVVGQIADYRGNSIPPYRGAYQAARDISDQVILVGDNAHKHRASDDDRAEGRVMEAASVKAVHDHVRATAVAGEIILLKSAQNLHLERIALAFTHDVKCWEDKCGREETCTQCGLFELPFAEHRATRKERRRQRDTLRAALSPAGSKS